VKEKIRTVPKLQKDTKFEIIYKTSNTTLRCKKDSYETVNSTNSWDRNKLKHKTRQSKKKIALVIYSLLIIS
jgi:hypothetical protein